MLAGCVSVRAYARECVCLSVCIVVFLAVQLSLSFCPPPPPPPLPLSVCLCVCLSMCLCECVCWSFSLRHCFFPFFNTCLSVCLSPSLSCSSSWSSVCLRMCFPTPPPPPHPLPLSPLAGCLSVRLSVFFSAFFHSVLSTFLTLCIHCVPIVCFPSISRCAANYIPLPCAIVGFVGKGEESETRHESSDGFLAACFFGFFVCLFVCFFHSKLVATTGYLQHTQHNLAHSGSLVTSL